MCRHGALARLHATQCRARGHTESIYTEHPILPGVTVLLELANCFFSVLVSDTLAFACTKGEVSHLSGRDMLGGVNGRMRVCQGL